MKKYHQHYAVRREGEEVAEILITTTDGRWTDTLTVARYPDEQAAVEAMRRHNYALLGREC